MRFRIFPILLCSLAVVSFTSCSDDDGPADDVTVENSDVAHLRQTVGTYNTLSFAWDKVGGVNQYGYSLLDQDGNKLQYGVTGLTQITFDDLDSDANYTFELRVYGPAGSPSYCCSLAASTLAIRQLATPQTTETQEGNRIRITWEPVEDAYAYRYTYVIGENTLTRTTTEPFCLISGLAPGTHQVEVQALSDYGGFTDSETVRVECIRTRNEIGTVDGEYTCGLLRRNNVWNCTMHIFDDDSYVIKAFYQGEGYDLDFYVDTDDATGEKFMGIYNFVEFPGAEYYVMETGRASVPMLDMIPGLTDGVYGSTFTTDGEHGSFTINTAYKEVPGMDTFVW